MICRRTGLALQRAAYAVSAEPNHLKDRSLSTDVQPAAAPTVTRSPSVGLAITALALGGFAIGTTEFVTMGLLPDIASGVHHSIPSTGHIISAYALGVVVGAPVIVSVAARLPRRGLAVALVLSLGLGNALTAVAGSYSSMMLARFVAGLPHGAYFGVASLLAASLVPVERRGRAVGSVMLGLSVATVAGVPASTWLGQNLGWRSAYWAVVGVTVLTAVLILAFVPASPGDSRASVRGELSALKKPQVLYAAAAGMIGFGGVFAMYSYIAPIVTDVTALSRDVIPWFLFSFGVGSVLGAWLAGRLADWNTVRTVVGGFVASVVVLVLVFALSPYAVPALAAVFAVGVLGSVLAINLQIRLMHAAGDAQMLGAALNHSALNIANGLGAWVGSVVITAGHGYRAPSLVGAGLAVAGLLVFLAGLVQERRKV
jgi:DHA1 family inner membrane transport protein